MVVFSVIVMLEDRGFVSVVLKYDAVFVKGLMVETSVVLLSEERSTYTHILANSM